MRELTLQTLAQTVLNQRTEIVHQPVISRIDQTYAVTFAADQPRSLQLTELTADVRLAEPGRSD